MSVAHEFGELFPAQFADISYGLSATPFPLLVDDSRLTYHVPAVGDAELVSSGEWTQLGFDESDWNRSENTSLSGGVGYAFGDAAPALEGQIATNVEGPMFLANSSLLARQEFEVADPADVDGLLVHIQFDDAFAAYLNGEKVAERFTPEGDLAWNSESDVPRRDRRRWDPLRPHQFDLGEHTDQLVPGTNVLAIQLLNESSSDEDVFVRATLTGFTMATDEMPEAIGYLTMATPGAVNRPLRGGSVDFSVPSQVFTEPLTVELTGSSAGQTIRFTTDGTDPTADSEQYTGAIQITGTTTIQATAFSSEGNSGPVSFAKYVHLADDDATSEFSSNLPLVVFTSAIPRVATSTVPQASARRPPADSFITVFEPDELGRTTLTSDAVLNTWARINRHGDDTAGNPKLNLTVQLWDQSGTDTPPELLGMPADADWSFHGVYNFDRTKGIRNSFFYEISNQIGRWAPRTRMVEVFHNVDGDDLTADDYQGVYIIIENIKRGQNRVDIQRLGPHDITEPDITGGWIWRIDRSSPGESGFFAGRQSIKWVDPEEVDVEFVPEQVQWSRDYFNEMGAVFRDRDSPWEQINEIIDVDSWIDHAIINTVTMNLEAYRLSGYFYKDRDRMLEMGPVWDCDRCMESEDGRDNDPEVWHPRVPDYGTDYFGYTWWRDLYRNQPDFWQAWIDRWFELREEVLSDDNMMSIVDHFAAQIEEAHPRDTAKWPQLRPNGGPFAPHDMRNWEGEVINLKNWLLARAKWIDERFVAPVTTTPDGGKLVPGQSITLSAPAGAIYYTTDGADPRASGGDVSHNALVYGGPISVDSATVITARAFDDSQPVELNPNRTHRDPRSGSFWSAPIVTRFTDEALANASNLRITEVNYSPPAATEQELQTLGVQELDPNEFEFIEVMNIGEEPVDLGGVQMVPVQAFDARQGVDFTFDPQMMAPGEQIVVVENVLAFQARFGNAVRIASGTDGTPNATQGEWGGGLANDGEALKLVDRTGDLIQRFSYSDSRAWPQRADGRGSSLELIDVHGDSTDPANWRASTEFGGSPGASGEEFAERVVVTELLTSTGQPQGDMIELHNTTGGDIDITGWFISNDENDLLKFRVTEPTVIPAEGYAVFTEQQMGFGLDGARGGQVLILEADSSGRPVRFAGGTQFPNSALNVSLGRWPDVHGEFFPMAQMTFGSANSGIRPGDVIISEVHYSPVGPDGAGRLDPEDFEFIELFNQTGGTIDLGGWRLTGDGVDWEFASETTLDSGATISLLPFNPLTRPRDAAIFRFFFGVGNSVQLAGDFRESRRTSLEDDGAHLRLEKPGAATDDDSSFTPYIWVDELTYGSQPPWPTNVIGNCSSLTRVSKTGPGFLPTNWIARSASPGAADHLVQVPGDATADGKFDGRDLMFVLESAKYMTNQAAGFTEGDWNGDGVFDPSDIVAALQAGSYPQSADVGNNALADVVFAQSGL